METAGAISPGRRLWLAVCFPPSLFYSPISPILSLALPASLHCFSLLPASSPVGEPRVVSGSATSSKQAGQCLRSSTAAHR